MDDECLYHRDKTRVQMPAKMFPDLKLLCLLFMGPTLGFDRKQRNSFLIKFGVFLQWKQESDNIIHSLKWENHTFGCVFSVVGAQDQQVFCMFKWGKKSTKTTQGACSSLISMILQLCCYYWPTGDNLNIISVEYSTIS